MFSAIFRWIMMRLTAKHIWVMIPDVSHEGEVYHTRLPNKAALCNTFNLIEDNEHEGAGWWERVWIVDTKHFSGSDLCQICHKERHYVKSPDFPELHDVPVYVDYTFLPKEILSDIENAPGKVIGFRPHKVQRDRSSTIVWIHLCKPKTSR